MSSFQDLYEHAAADRGRAMQFLAIQEIRRKAVREMTDAGVYVEPESADELTDEEHANRRAEAAYAFGVQSVIEVAKLPGSDGEVAYAAAVRDPSTRPYSIALCIQTKLEELHAAGAEDRCQSGEPQFHVVVSNPDADESAEELGDALDVLRVAYPQWRISLEELSPELREKAARAEQLRSALDACKADNTQENLQKVAALLFNMPLVFPAVRPENEPQSSDGGVHLQFGKVRAQDGKSYFLAFSDRAHLLQWKQYGSVELQFKDYVPLVLQSKDNGIIVDPYVGAGMALTSEMLQMLQAEQEMFSAMMQAASEMTPEQIEAFAAAVEKGEIPLPGEQPDDAPAEKPKWWQRRKK